MNKVIFLDIDGVLNGDYTEEKFTCKDDNGRSRVVMGICHKRLAIFKRILAETKAKVVLSSTWRKKPEDLAYVTSHFDDAVIIGCTPILDEFTGMIWVAPRRGDEIKAWLDQHYACTCGNPGGETVIGRDGLCACKDCGKPNNIDRIDRWCIIDDDFAMLEEQKPHFFPTNHYNGLTEADAVKVIAYLNAPRVQTMPECRMPKDTTPAKMKLSFKA